MSEEVLRWIIGLFVALYGGHVAARLAMLLHWGRAEIPPLKWRVIFGCSAISPPGLDDAQSASVPAVSPWLTGITERLLFALVAAFSNVGFAASSGVFWLAIKAAIIWESRLHDTSKKQEEKPWEEEVSKEALIRMAQVSVYGGLVSILFALLGGLIIDGKICIWICD